MASSGGLSTSARLHAAFSKPLYQRCADINKLLEDTSTKELHTILPVLLENIFGFNNQPGWGIGRISRSHYYEFNAIRQLLHPDGPLLKLVYRLTSDPYFRYEFPLSCVPMPSRQLIEEGAIPMLYGGKVQCNAGGRPYTMLSINAFEFYFFHFAYFLVNPHMSRASSISSAKDSAVFTMVLEEYLNYFLPLDGKHVAPMLQASQAIKSPLVTHSPAFRASPSPGCRTSPVNSCGRTHYVSLLRSEPARSPLVSPPSSPMVDQAEPETWRSQSFLQVLVEFWLNQTSLDFDRMALSQASVHGYHWGSPRGMTFDPYMYMMVESFLPSSDHVRVVRMLVKHLHYFINSARVEIITSPYSAPMPCGVWEDFKRSVMPHMVQKKLYSFLKHGFERWPLDSSFRLILETWLSFIQPWRYTDPSQSNREREHDIKDRVVDNKWRQFVVDNLLFYTTLFSQFLQRFLRVDLSGAKNAYMLFRVTKVLSLPNLREIIEDVESSLYEPMNRLQYASTATGASPDLGASYLSPLQRHHGNLANILHVQFSELETSGFKYQPMFGQHTLAQAQQLMSALSQAKETAKAATSTNADASSTSFLSWFGLGGSPDFNASRFVATDGYDDIGGGGDPRRVIPHIELSLANLSHIYQLDVPERAEKVVKWGDSIAAGGRGRVDDLIPDVYDTVDGPKLSPLGRYQLMNGLRKFDVAFQGDPDLQPIRSFESPALVRMLHTVSAYINEKHHRTFDRLYHREDVVGRVAQQFLSPPYPVGTPEKMKGLSPVARHRISAYHHPRLTLRWLASYQTLGFLLVLFATQYAWLGLGPVPFLLLLALAVAIVSLARAVTGSAASPPAPPPSASPAHHED